MAYEKLSKNKRSIQMKPIITIGSQGVLYLNTFSMREYFQGVDWVILLFDREKNYLAVKPVKKEEEDSFRLTFSSVKEKSTGVIAARSVIKALKVDYSKKKHYEAIWNKKEGLLEINLKQK